MTTNPFVNALVASGYITIIATAITSAPPFENHLPLPIAPVLFLSLFVFSAALMGYVILYQPLRLLSEGKSPEAARFFLLTLGSLALITAAAVGTMLLVAAL